MSKDRNTKMRDTINRLNMAIVERDNQIAQLRKDIRTVSVQTSSMSNTLADYASMINSLAHYIIDQPTSTTIDSRDYANDALDHIIPHLESE